MTEARAAAYLLTKEALGALPVDTIVLVRSPRDYDHAWTKRSQSYVNDEGIEVWDQWAAHEMGVRSSERLLSERGPVTIEALYIPGRDLLAEARAEFHVSTDQRDGAIAAATHVLARQARYYPDDGLLHDVIPGEAADAAVRSALEFLGVSVSNRASIVRRDRPRSLTETSAEMAAMLTANDI